ncbi:MFS transporter [Allostreptomyces psammosilenae]|uniref:DHA2 family methylenomycin A resistance protein-like MFS transporter n=1 Tax=Allostreptomyces psammosilenae TaxID=1892865 RepID=A0A853A521_9ACTN|nr:MFS transporter [Allostreptomyces psammosilenae]NYI05592.1 DHA2 family methylenomycin A resistance protein-like MFS transporter [Allostreptomyces psammosilenae]
MAQPVHRPEADGVTVTVVPRRVPDPPPAPPAPEGRRRALALLALCLGNFLVLLDMTIVNLALPRIRDDLGGPLGAMEWVAGGYALAVAAFLLGGGSVSDRIGNDRAFRWGIVGFTALSVACSLAPGLGFLVVARVAQGVCTALLLPSLLGLIPHLFEDAGDRARAVSLWASSGAAAAAAGPLAGGILVDLIGWRSIFCVHLPLGAAAWLIVRRNVPAAPRRATARLDVPGQVLAVLGLTALYLALVGRPSLGWNGAAVGAATAVGIAALVAFVRVERRRAAPLLPPRLFADRVFSAAVATGLLWQFVIFGQLFALSLYLQTVQQRSALAAGLAFLPMTLVAALLPSPTMRRLVPRWGFGRTLVAGGVCGLAACAVLLLCGAGSPYWPLGVALLLLGVFGGLTLPVVAALVVAHTPPGLSGTGSGVLNTARQLGGVLGVSVLGSVAGDIGGSLVGGLHVGAAISAVALTGVVLLARRVVDR